ncbi:MAG: hypothetical protein HQL97_01275 [Magnetococcales bacterium]|nr:hypothetical protein [Magnetococcales bacterium]
MTDFLEFGTLLAVRLAEAIPTATVIKAFNLPELDDTLVTGTTLFVISEGYDVKSLNNNGKTIEVEQVWSVLVATRDPDALGVLSLDVIRALAGWEDGTEKFARLDLVGSGSPGSGRKSGWTQGGVHYDNVSFMTTFYLDTTS